MCKQLLDRRAGEQVRLECYHEVHLDCLKKEALKLAGDALDPDRLLQLECGTCYKLINERRLQEAVGRRWIESKRQEVVRRMQVEFVNEDRKRNQKLAD